MQARFEQLKAKKCIGKRLKMSLLNNKTAELWHSFMPLRKNVSNPVSSDLISLQIYNDTYFQQFNPNNEFEKWALVEVIDNSIIPEGFEKFDLEAGLYAVFHHKGSSTDNSIFEYIFTKWLPQSAYELDNRPHFELLGANYKNGSPDSEEEIWIPVKAK